MFTLTFYTFKRYTLMFTVSSYTVTHVHYIINIYTVSPFIVTLYTVNVHTVTLHSYST